MNKQLILIRTLCWLFLSSLTVLHSRAQCLTVSPASIWAGGAIHVIQKADHWIEQSTGTQYNAADALSGVSGTYTFPQFGEGGLTIIETQFYYSDEKKYYLTGPPGTYNITAGTETIRVHIVDINAIQTTPADPIKIGDLVNFSVTTNPADLDGDPRPSTLHWDGEVSEADLTATSTWTTGGYKAVSVRSDGTWSGAGSLGGVFQSTIVSVYELTGLTVDKEFPDADENVTWTATVEPNVYHPEVVEWTGGWITATTTGLTHSKSFPKTDFPGTKMVTATCGTSTRDNTIRLERVEIASIVHDAQFVDGPAWTLNLVNSSADVLWEITGPTTTPDQSGGSSFTLNPGANPGKYTVSVSIDTDGVPPKTVSLDLTAVRLVVKEASLVSSGSGFAEVQDDSGAPYAPPFWTPAMDPPTSATAADVVPVQYQRGGLVAMDAKFTVEPSDWSGTVKVKSVGDFTLEQKDFIPGSGELVVAALKAESTSLLPNIVDWQKNKSCSWQCSVDGGTFFGDAKNSRHAYYTTLNGPDAERRTVVHLACKNTGAADEHMAIINAWTSFSGAGTVAWDGTEMTYWGPKQYQPDEDILVSERDGSCGAWAPLLMRVFAVHKVSSSNPKLTSVYPNDPSPRPLLALPFQAAYGFHIFQPYRGQNNPNPEWKFLNHQLVKYEHGTATFPGGTSTVYLMDPSYGTLRTGTSGWSMTSPPFGLVDAWPVVEKQWEDLSVENYAWDRWFWPGDLLEANDPNNVGVRFSP